MSIVKIVGDIVSSVGICDHASQVGGLCEHCSSLVLVCVDHSIHFSVLVLGDGANHYG